MTPQTGTLPASAGRLPDGGHDAARRDRRSALARRVGRLAAIRAAIMLPLTALISLLVFWLASLSPFDPLRSYLGTRYTSATDAQRAELARTLGLDDAWYAIWGRWATAVLHGDWGTSSSLSRPVTEVITEALPYTLLLAGAGLALAIAAALLLGVRAAWAPGGVLDRCATALAYLLQAIPPFVIGLVLIAVFALGFGIPVGGVSTAGADPTPGSIAAHLVAPAIVLGASQMPWLLLAVRTSVLEAMVSDHVRAARSRGLGDGSILWRHALPGALLPFVSVLGARLPELVTGALLVEAVFSWPGLASATVDAAVAGDFPLLAAVTVLTSLAVLTGSLLADALYLCLDPRVDDV